MAIDTIQIQQAIGVLEKHSIYKSIQNIQQLRTFMEHHVYCVWDFMSLVKSLQHAIAPSNTPWYPPKEPHLTRFINEIVLEEESDVLSNGTGYMSHFEMYLEAMREIGADTSNIAVFSESVQKSGVEYALKECEVPVASQVFMQNTFTYLAQDKPHIVAAAFSFGREEVIPIMFKRILKNLGVSKKQAPMFHYYLERHIHLDEGFHGPLAMQLLEHLSQSDRKKEEQVTVTAIGAIQARIELWHRVLKLL